MASSSSAGSSSSASVSSAVTDIFDEAELAELEEESAAELSDHAYHAFFKSICDGSIKGSSKENYRNKLKTLKKWCSNGDLGLLDVFNENGKLNVPMSNSNFEKILAHLCENQGNGQPRAFSTIQGYISAIKYEYACANLKLDEHFVTQLKTFSEGLKRRIAGKKQSGEMKRHEGKEPFIVSVFIRAGWSLGNVHDRYFHMFAGGEVMVRSIGEHEDDLEPLPARTGGAAC
jgi:hypothetical protein